MALILINRLEGTALLVTVGLYYIVSGLYFRVPTPVQPMKVIGAYAIARELTPLDVSMAGLWVGVFLLLLAGTGAISLIGRLVPKPTIRGVQLATGVLLLTKGIHFMLGETALQNVRAEPFLSVQSLGPIPIGIVLGGLSILVILLLLGNRRVPASLAVLGGGAAIGLILGAHRGLADLHLGFHLPSVLPYSLPATSAAFFDQAVLVLTVLALPQIPMTVGNAILAQSDLTREYFGEAAGKRQSPRALSLSMGLANVGTAFFGGMPMCHGAGGLAAHVRFGAKTASANLVIGPLLLLLGLLFGSQAIVLLRVVPLSVLGALLVFAGAELALAILDVKDRKALFVVIAMLGIALATNLAVAFLVGIVLAYGFKIRLLKG
jgi:SulP family sulfate permease